MILRGARLLDRRGRRSMMTLEPDAEARRLYRGRLEQRNADAAALRGRERTVSIVRLLLIAIAIGVALWKVALAIVPVAAFVVLVVVHERLVRRRKRAESGAAFYARGLARIEGTWPGEGDAGDDFAEDHHPYAGDFDLFGRGSLFELVSVAVTPAGRARLARWLREPERDVREIRARQGAVLELRDNVDLREDFAVEASEVVREIASAKLDAWGAMPAMTLSPLERVLSIVLPAITVILLLLTIPAWILKLMDATHGVHFGGLENMPSWPAIVAVVVTGLFARRLHPHIEPIILS